MKIYTKKGDTGRTIIFSGKRLSKVSSRIECLGEIDELNSILGIVTTYCTYIVILNKIRREQSNLLRLGADIATPLEAENKFQNAINRIELKDVSLLEAEIDEWEKELHRLTKFIIPGGSKVSSFTHHARSVCRRVERSAVKLGNEEDINPDLISYLNRLSDWLFTLARYLNKLNKCEDILNPN